MKKKEQSKIIFDKHAKKYDETIIYKNPRNNYEIMLKKLDLVEGSSILDVGCGTGGMLKLITDKYQNIKAYGIDLSDEMIKIARKKLSNDVKLSVGDSECLPFLDNNFDVIICMESFHHYPNPSSVLQEFKRVLKPNGILLICDMWRIFPIRNIMSFFMKFLNTGDVKIYSKKEIIDFINNAGFINVEYEQISQFAYIVKSEKMENDGVL